MKVANIMQTEVRTVNVDTPVSEVVVSLADAQVSGLPVVDARNRVIGVVFEYRLDQRAGGNAQCRRAANPAGADARTGHHDPEASHD